MFEGEVRSWKRVKANKIKNCNIWDPPICRCSKPVGRVIYSALTIAEVDNGIESILSMLLVVTGALNDRASGEYS